VHTGTPPPGIGAGGVDVSGLSSIQRNPKINFLIRDGETSGIEERNPEINFLIRDGELLYGLAIGTRCLHPPMVGVGYFPSLQSAGAPSA